MASARFRLVHFSSETLMVLRQLSHAIKTLLIIEHYFFGIFIDMDKEIKLSWHEIFCDCNNLVSTWSDNLTDLTMDNLGGNNNLSYGMFYNCTLFYISQNYMMLL